SADDGTVPSHQGGEALFWLVGQVPWVFQQQPARALEGRLLLPCQAPHFAPPYLVDRLLQMFDDMKTIEQNLRLGSMLPHQVHIGGPHVHAHYLQSRTTSPPQFFREELLDRFFGAVFAPPQQDSPLQIVDHRQVNLPFAPADFIDADDMDRRPLTIPQTITHRPLHDSGHGLPVQPVLPCGALPTQFPGQTSYRIRECSGHPRPTPGPRKSLDSYSTPRTLYSTWLITQKQMHLSHQQVPPFPLLPHAVHLRAPFPTYPTPQPSIPQALDADDHLLFASFDCGHAVGFQAQLFSDKRFNEHLGPFPFSGLFGHKP